MLDYTGQPFIDVGLATIKAHAGKHTISELESEDMAKFSDYIEQHYFVNPTKSLLSTVFPNSAYAQPNLKPVTKQQFIDLVIRGYRSETPKIEDSCIFTNKPAVMRIFREHFPLLASGTVSNFYANGGAGLPVCGEVILALQALPLGALLCEGRLLVVHSDNQDLFQDFARICLEENRKQIDLIESLSLSDKDKKFSGSRYPKTVLIEHLLKLERERDSLIDESETASITAYWFTNYGTNANVEIFYLPSQILRFVSLAKSFHYTAWNELTKRAWHEVGTKKINNQTITYRRNYLYEDLFSLPLEARRFLQTYFLRLPAKKGGEGSPLRAYSLKEEFHLISWNIVELFLEEVMNMDKTRIEAIRRMGDNLANYARDVDFRLFNRLFRARYYRELSYELCQVKKNAAAKGQSLFTFDDFVEVFAESEDVPRLDWSLARDLVLIRMIDQLSNLLNEKKDELEEATRDVVALD